MDNSNRGKLSEYEAASYFIASGYKVYWPAVERGSVDFIVDILGSFKKVQVKTAHWVGDCLRCKTTNTTWKFLKDNKNQPPAKEKYDILFIIAPCGSKWLIPAEVINQKYITLRGYKRKNLWGHYEV